MKLPAYLRGQGGRHIDKALLEYVSARMRRLASAAAGAAGGIAAAAAGGVAAAAGGVASAVASASGWRGGTAAHWLDSVDAAAAVVVSCVGSDQRCAVRQFGMALRAHNSTQARRADHPPRAGRPRPPPSRAALPAAAPSSSTGPTRDTAVPLRFRCYSDVGSDVKDSCLRVWCCRRFDISVGGVKVSSLMESDDTAAAKHRALVQHSACPRARCCAGCPVCPSAPRLLLCCCALLALPCSTIPSARLLLSPFSLCITPYPAARAQRLFFLCSAFRCVSMVLTACFLCLFVRCCNPRAEPLWLSSSSAELLLG